MTIATILAAKGGDVVQATDGATVAEVVAMLTEHRIGAMPVIDADGAVIGIVSERDILYCLAGEGAGMLDRQVSDVMTAPAITVRPDTAIIAALSLMTRRRIRHLPVVEQGRLLGFVSIGDLVKARVDRAEAEAAALRDYISTA